MADDIITYILLLCYTGINPSLSDVFRELFPLASNWKCIGTFLEVKDHVIDGIESNKEDVTDKLRAMLSKRIKETLYYLITQQVSLFPMMTSLQPVNETKPLTWDDIVDAIKPIDQRKSEDLRKRIPK